MKRALALTNKMIKEFKKINYFDLETRRGNLPHWEQNDVIYFVTFRLADSIPQNKLKALKQAQKNWLQTHSKPYSELEQKQYYELFNDRVQKWLDQEYGSCILKEKGAGKIIADALCFFDKQRYNLDEWVVMSNHVHVLVKIESNFSLPKITHSWKSYSGNKINLFLGRNGECWMDESYDHIVRSPGELELLRDYIRANPKTSNFKEAHASWLYKREL